MKNIFHIIKISRPMYPLIGLISTLIVLGALLDLVAPILSKYMVDEVIAHIQHHGGSLTRLTTLITIAFVMSLVGIVFSGISDRLGDHLGGKMRKYLTEMFYEKVLTLPQSYFDTELSGKIVNQLNRGITSIQQFLNSSSNFLLPTLLQSVFTIIVLAYYNPPTALFVSLLFPVYLTISYYSTKKWGQYEVQKNALEDVSRGRITEVISNIKVVKSFLNEKDELQFVQKRLTNVNKIYAEQSTFYHIFDFCRNFSLILVLLIVNVIVFRSTFAGTISVGTMVLILQLINQARRPLFAMSFILTQIQTAESGSKEFIEVLQLPSKEDFKEKIGVEKLQDPRLRFDHISFKYENSELVLKDVSFDINPKEQVALVGHSGAGKSTIVNLILKFYDPASGDIILNDKSYRQLSARFVRNNIALVFQENELFSSTIRENIAYGSPYVSDDKIIEALKLANAYDFVMHLPKGLDSEVGERGVRLSGGQKQRIQIARAILKDSPILILDEATSNLDAKSESEVQEALENLMKNKMVIIIAHRFSTIQNVNKVIVLDQGTIVDCGTPKELSVKAGIYKDLLTYQIEGNKKLLKEFDIY